MYSSIYLVFELIPAVNIWEAAGCQYVAGPAHKKNT